MRFVERRRIGGAKVDLYELTRELEDGPAIGSFNILVEEREDYGHYPYAELDKAYQVFRSAHPSGDKAYMSEAYTALGALSVSFSKSFKHLGRGVRREQMRDIVILAGKI